MRDDGAKRGLEESIIDCPQRILQQARAICETVTVKLNDPYPRSYGLQSPSVIARARNSVTPGSKTFNAYAGYGEHKQL